MNKNKISKIPVLLLSICLATICMACEKKPLQNDVNLNVTPVESAERMNAETYAAAEAEEQEADNTGGTENPREIQDYGETAVLWPSKDIAAPKPQTEEPATPQPVESFSAEEPAGAEEPPSAEEPAEGLFPYAQFPFVFTAEDIYGNTVTEATLGEKRLFLIHHWATWCGVCVGGLPDLSKVFPTSVIIDGSGEMFEPKLIGSYGERYALFLDILLE